MLGTHSTTVPKDEIRSILEQLEARFGRPRLIARFDPMDELVSCILSQHTSDANSFPAFTNLRATYPDWQDVVDAGPERVADAIRKAGLANQKSKNIVACLIEIYTRFGSYTLEPLRTMPTLQARKWLMELPGVGPKTASIVLCFSMGRETIPVDTHVYRVSWRIGILPEHVGEVKAHDLLLDSVPSELAFRYHVDLIQHGRVICKAPLPNCSACPIRERCRWFQAGGPEQHASELKVKRRKVAKAP
ncbi:MAG: endonuclease III [Fimbriimonas sp.]|nr:endonuclease III [Fimbriimonas sp.]